MSDMPTGGYCMTGKSTLLKITSVLLIVFGAMAVLMNGIALAGMA